CPSGPWHDGQRSWKIASPFLASSLATGTSAVAAIVFWPRHGGLAPTSVPRASHVMYAASARTSFDVGDGSAVAAPTADPSPPSAIVPVEFSLRRKQSTIRSVKLYRRPDRLLYS